MTLLSAGRIAMVGLPIFVLASTACSSSNPQEEVVSSADPLTDSPECSGAAILDRIADGPRRDVVARAVWRIGSKPKYNPNVSSGGYRNDCSGFTAAAWLDRNEPSTAYYPPFRANPSFVEVPFEQLQPGDALNRRTQSSCKIGTCGHIRLFGGFIDGDTSRFCVLEHAGPYGAPPHARLGTAADLAGYAPIKNLALPDVGGAPAPAPDPPAAAAAPAAGCGVLGVNEALGVDQVKTSCDGRFSLVMQGDGNVVLYQDGAAPWNAGTVGSGATALVMQGDGNLVAYQDGGAAVWSTGTNGNDGAVLDVQSDGNVVLVRDGRTLWSTGTGGR